jgi:hypothetical protein
MACSCAGFVPAFRALLLPFDIDLSMPKPIAALTGHFNRIDPPSRYPPTYNGGVLPCDQDRDRFSNLDRVWEEVPYISDFRNGSKTDPQSANVRCPLFPLPAQPVDATQELNPSAGNHA